MNKQTARGLDNEMPTTPTSEAAIVDYLQHNPDFFERNAPLLTKLRFVTLPQLPYPNL